MTTNSSPPIRATVSLSRTPEGVVDRSETGQVEAQDGDMLVAPARIQRRLQALAQQLAVG
jgi:hypothetical protein